jgi:hypothetical protein
MTNYVKRERTSSDQATSDKSEQTVTVPKTKPKQETRETSAAKEQVVAHTKVMSSPIKPFIQTESPLVVQSP